MLEIEAIFFDTGRGQADPVLDPGHRPELRPGPALKAERDPGLVRRVEGARAPVLKAAIRYNHYVRLQCN